MTNTYSKGFTLIELLISISIVSLLLSTVLFNYSTFLDNLSVSSAEQEVAANIRQAQTFGINVRETAASSGQFDYAYGVHFDPANNPTIYTTFIDSVVDHKYTSQSGCGGATECIERVAYRNGVRVTNVCDATTCYNNKTLHITFKRPNPDAIMYLVNSDGTDFTPSPMLTARIELTSRKGRIVYVTVESTGQILVQ